MQFFYLYKVLLENYEYDNCAKVLEEEFYKVIYGNFLNDKHVYNVITMSSMNINDANNMQSYKLGDDMFDEDDVFSPPTYDDKIYYDDSLPPIYDDYCDDTYAIINSDNHTCETCHNYKYPSTEHYSFNEELIFSVHVLYDTLTITNDKKFAYGETNKNICMWIMKRMLYVIVILLNLFMMPLKIIMREGHVLIDILIIPSFLSLC